MPRSSKVRGLAKFESRLKNRYRESFLDEWSSGFRTIAVHVPIPVSVAQRARSVILPFPYPNQRQRMTRSIRLKVRPRRESYVTTKVRIAVPNVLPATRASAVQIDRRGRIVIRGASATRKVLEREFNRRRYQEHKTAHRKARHGQIDSLGRDSLGIVGEAIVRGLSARRLMDAALVSRAMEL